MPDIQSIYSTSEWEVLTPSGWQSFDGVVVTHGKNTIIIDGLECTDNHLIKMGDEFVRADTLEHEPGKTNVDVFDLLNVAGGNEYYTNDYISHNCDELAFVATNLADEFFTSVYPTIIASKDSKVIMTSTPNGLNHFHRFWKEAEAGINGFTPVRAHWYEMPGRDQEWYKTQCKMLGELKAKQEIDAEFMGSSSTLLTGTTLSRLTPTKPQKEYGDGPYCGLRIYEEPINGRMYTMTVDVSRGRHLDASAFMVFDVTEYPHRIVASYNNNEVAPLMYSGMVYQLAKQYNEAYILVEINDIGAQVADELWNSYEYENLYWTKSGDVLGKKGADPYPGIRTTKKTKRIGCANLKDIIEKNELEVIDSIAINELGTFIQSKSGSYEADEGYHDDAVMCLVMFSWLVSQPWFKDLFNRDIRNQMYLNAIKQMEDDLHMGFFNDGNENIESEQDLSIQLLTNNAWE